MPKVSDNPADYIKPLNMNGLEGRILHIPDYNKKNREVLFVYGQHSSLERWWGLVQEFSNFGAVTMADLPGFGGMTSLYKINQTAEIDNLADYLAAFIKLRYKRKKVAIFGMSLGFVIVTRMLQRYPDLTKKVEMLVSIVGFAHQDDFVFSRSRHAGYVLASRIFSMRVPSWVFQNVFLQPFYLRRVYHFSSLAKEKFDGKKGDEFKKTMDAEVILWHINDLRTQMKTNVRMLTLDNTKTRVNLPVFHVASKSDRYFNHVRVEEHLRQIYKDFCIFYTKDPNHAPTVIADSKAAAAFIPDELRRIMTKKNR